MLKKSISLRRTKGYSKVFGKIKLHLFQRAFKRELVHLHRTMIHKRFEDIQSMLIIFDAGSEEKCLRFLTFFDQLKERSIAVKAIGITNEKQLPAYCVPKMGVDYLLNSHLTHIFVPNEAYIKDIIRTRFDLLLDLSFCSHPTVKWITALSMASFKAGSSCSCVHNYLDMVIDTGSNKDFVFLFDQIEQYLRSFK